MALCGLLLTTNVGCPDCEPAVQVRFVKYTCEESPCSQVEPVGNPGYSLEWSVDGGPFSPCSGNSCGKDAGGCGGVEDGLYEIVARGADGSVRSQRVAVSDYRCTTGGEGVEFVVGGLPPLPRCQPTATTVGPVTGSATWQLDGWSGAVDAPVSEAPKPLQSSAEVYFASDTSDELVVDERVAFTAFDGDRFLQVSVALGDLRDVEAGESFVVGVDDGALRVFAEHECTAGLCTTGDDADGVLVEILEAEGAPVPWPAVVSDDFRLRYRVTFDAVDLVASAATSEGCELCDAPLSVSFDLTFERSADDYDVTDRDDCDAGPPRN